MTIVFSVVLAVFVLGSIIYLLQRCKQRLQYSHHPLHMGKNLNLSSYLTNNTKTFCYGLLQNLSFQQINLRLMTTPW